MCANIKLLEVNVRIKKSNLKQEDIMNILDNCYDKCLCSIPNISPSVEKMAKDYIKKNKNKDAASKDMLHNQIIKCTTSGILTGFGGFITLPVAIPANVDSVLYVQMRMIACAAYMAGYDLDSDQVQTFNFMLSCGCINKHLC